jgi:hypothetical protein
VRSLRVRRLKDVSAWVFGVAIFPDLSPFLDRILFRLEELPASSLSCVSPVTVLFLLFSASLWFCSMKRSYQICSLAVFVELGST